MEVLLLIKVIISLICSIRKYGLPGDMDSWHQVFVNAKHKLIYDLGSKDMEWIKAADFFRQMCLEQGQ